MACKKIILLCILPLLIPACADKPIGFIDNPQSSQRYYTFSVLLTPEFPADSPKLEVGLSLYHVRHSSAQAAFINQLLYSSANMDSYKDRVVMEQRENYRKTLSYLKNSNGENLRIFDMEGFEIDGWGISNWHYTEKFVPISRMDRGMVIERTRETYTGGAHGMLTKRYFVIDLEAQKLLRIDDFIDDYQGDRVRDLIYDELRRYSGLGRNQPLSSGIYLYDDPELTFNFFITTEGLGLHWNPYEIAPYSQGSIQIMLPWRKIRPLLLNSGMELLAKFNINLLV
jgi:hypothetical protein